MPPKVTTTPAVRRPSGRSRRQRARDRVEWPTLGVALLIYTGFGLLTVFYHALAWWFVAPAAGYLIAWHGSLQHETIHGHPTSRPWLNELLVFPSLWLWMPYRTYRDTHRTHHHDERLTDPLDDPESYYETLGQWLGYSRGLRGLFWFANTMVGRLLVGPLIAVCQLATDQCPRLLGGERGAWRHWTLHIPACLCVLVWVMAVCNISLADYLLLFVYPGLALSLLRSFAEHQAAPAAAERSVIVDAAWPMALLYLNNNLHALHHREPGIAWYRLPARYRAQRDDLLYANGGYRFSGYGEIIARYFIWPKEPPVHPLDAAPSGRPASVAAPREK